MRSVWDDGLGCGFLVAMGIVVGIVGLCATVVLVGNLVISNF